MPDLPQLRKGQNVKVIQRVSDGKRERNVPFVGKLLRVRGIGPNKMITLRQILESVAVDRIFPIASPTIARIDLISEKKAVSKKSVAKPDPKTLSSKISKKRRKRLK